MNERTLGIGGTDIAAIVGLNPWKTPMQVYLEKHGMAEPVPQNMAMTIGLMLEPAVFELYRATEGHGSADFYQPPLLQHSTRHWQIGTPDRLHRSGNRVVELKTTGMRQAQYWGARGTQDIPGHYLLQVAWYLSLTGAEYADVAVLIGGQDFRVYHLQRDRELEQMLLEAGEDFWVKHVLAQEPPAIDGSPQTARYLAQKYQQHTDDMIQASPDLDRLAIRLRGEKRMVASCEPEILKLENELKNVIGEKLGILGSWGKITWKETASRTVTDWKALAQAMNPSKELIEKFTNTSAGTRRFLAQFEEQD